MITSSFEKTNSILYFATQFAEGLAVSVFGPAMVFLSRRADCPVSEIGLVIAFYNVGFILFSLLMVQLYNLYQGNRIIGCALIIMSAALLLLSMAENKFLIFSCAGIMGIAGGATENGSNILFPWLLGERAKRPLNIIYLFYSAGCIITFYLIGISLDVYASIAPVLILISLIIVIPAVCLLNQPSPEVNNNAELVIQSDSTVNYRSMLIACLYGMILFMASSGMTIFNSWCSTVLINNGWLNEAGAAKLGALLWVGSMLGRLVGAILASKLLPRTILFCGLFGAITVGIVLFFCKGNVLLIGLCIILTGFMNGPIYANTLLLMKNEGLVSAKVNGIVMALGQAGCIFIPTLFGKIYGNLQNNFIPFASFTLFASLSQLVLCTIVIYNNRREKQRKHQANI